MCPYILDCGSLCGSLVLAFIYNVHIDHFAGHPCYVGTTADLTAGYYRGYKGGKLSMLQF